METLRAPKKNIVKMCTPSCVEVPLREDVLIFRRWTFDECQITLIGTLFLELWIVQLCINLSTVIYSVEWMRQNLMLKILGKVGFRVLSISENRNCAVFLPSHNHSHYFIVNTIKICNTKPSAPNFLQATFCVFIVNTIKTDGGQGHLIAPTHTCVCVSVFRASSELIILGNSKI